MERAMQQRTQRFLASGIMLGGAAILAQPRAAEASSTRPDLDCPGANYQCLWDCQMTKGAGDNLCWYAGGEPVGCCAIADYCGYDVNCQGEYSISCAYVPEPSGGCEHYD